MKFLFCLSLIFFIIMNNVSYGQSFECDNQYNDCGSPNQSGGGGGGKGSVLINNTDLGDTYQNADDFDDDGIEDSEDNCMRYPNPLQIDSDGDGRGDFCDNCLDYYNPNQNDLDGDNWGDFCDDDIDGDNILNIVDNCPYHWGESCNHNNYNNNTIINHQDSSDNEENNNLTDNIDILKESNCDQKSESQVFFLLTLIISIRFL